MVVRIERPEAESALRRIPLLALVLSAVLACGPEPAPPVPHLSSLDPASAEREGPGFTLTLTGTGFAAGAKVLWNQTPLPTTLVSSSTLTAQVGPERLRVADDQLVSVASAAGDQSNTLVFTIPCRLPQTQGAARQTRARIGAIYFDGWSGPLSNFHFDGLTAGTFSGREPLSGWQDGSRCAVEQQLLWAKSFGIEFFAFDWYYDAARIDPDENLNGAFGIMRALPDKHGMKYALIYVNQDPFIVPTGAAWTSTVASWVGYMQDPEYVRVDGRPLLIVIDAYRMHHDLGSAAVVRSQFDELRSAARAQGLSGVYLVAGLFIPDGVAADEGLFPDLSAVAADGYDAVSAYTLYFAAPLATSGATPFGVLDETIRSTWTQAVVKSPVAVVPLAMVGADHRASSGDHETGRPIYWFERQPDQAAASISALVDLVEANPRIRPEPSPAPPLVMVGSWNEISNGEYLVPTVEEGTAMGDAIGGMLASPHARARTVLELENDGGSLTGRLTDASGTPLGNEPITIEVFSRTGAYAEYKISGHSPPDAGHAVVGFRINSDDSSVLWPSFWLAGEGAADLSLYQVSYVEQGDGAEHVPDPSFSGGSAWWNLGGVASFAPSDRGPGTRVRVVAAPEEAALLTSLPFPVSERVAFELTFAAQIAPGTESAGLFFVSFEDRTGYVLHVPGESVSALPSETTPMTPVPGIVGLIDTDTTGAFTVDLPLQPSERAKVFVRYPGDAGLWPAFGSVGR